MSDLPTTTLGRTGLQVRVAGLGCGGHSRLGQRSGASFDESVRLVQRAVDLGVDLVDTARAYRTEEIVGAALRGRPDVVVSTKSQVTARDAERTGLPARALRESVELSLRRLERDCVDVFHLHGVPLSRYGHCRAELVPELLGLRDEGKIRFLAISEAFASDPGHRMLAEAVEDDCWDVMMVGLNLLNPSARDRVLAATQRSGVGVLVMFAVRRALSQPAELARVVAGLVESGQVDPGAIDPTDPLGFLVREGGARSVVEAAYRFARHEPGTHVVLTGTGSLDHLEENLASLALPPLPAPVLERLDAAFGRVDSVSGN